MFFCSSRLQFRDPRHSTLAYRGCYLHSFTARQVYIFFKVHRSIAANHHQMKMMSRRQWSVAAVSTLLLLYSQVILVGASSIESSSPVSVRALDKYGESEQILNAAKAASLHGTLVVAARDASKNCTLVLSLLDTPSRLSSSQQQPPQPAMLQLLHNPPAFVRHEQDSTTTSTTAMVCTGLKGDATWLLQQVRSYSHRVWARYNTFVDATGAAHAVSHYMQRFWGFSDQVEWTPEFLLERDEQALSWSRPLGVVVMVVSSSLPYVIVVEPSGWHNITRRLPWEVQR